MYRLIMHLIQEKGARHLKRFVAAKSRDFDRAGVEAELWRERCEGIQRR